MYLLSPMQSIDLLPVTVRLSHSVSPCEFVCFLVYLFLI